MHALEGLLDEVEACALAIERTARAIDWTDRETGEQLELIVRHAIELRLAVRRARRLLGLHPLAVH